MTEFNLPKIISELDKIPYPDLIKLKEAVIETVRTRSTEEFQVGDKVTFKMKDGKTVTARIVARGTIKARLIELEPNPGYPWNVAYTLLTPIEKAGTAKAKTDLDAMLDEVDVKITAKREAAEKEKRAAAIAKEIESESDELDPSTKTDKSIAEEKAAIASRVLKTRKGLVKI